MSLKHDSEGGDLTRDFATYTLNFLVNEKTYDKLEVQFSNLRLRLFWNDNSISIK